MEDYENITNHRENQTLKVHGIILCQRHIKMIVNDSQIFIIMVKKVDKIYFQNNNNNNRINKFNNFFYRDLFKEG